MLLDGSPDTRLPSVAGRFDPVDPLTVAGGPEQVADPGLVERRGEFVDPGCPAREAVDPDAVWSD